MRRLLATLTAALMLAGCSASSPEKVIPIPEGGWTADELAAQVYLGDDPVGFPCKLDELKEHFEVADASQTMGDSFKNCYFLRYNGESVGNVIDSDGDGRIEKLNLLGTDKLNSAPVTVNGVGLGSTEKELSERLGGEIGHTDTEGERVFSLSLNAGGLLLIVTGNEKNGVKLITIEGE